jgi:hypothetical protein
MVSNSPYGIAGPKGIAPEIVKVLHDGFKKGLDEPSNVATIAQLDQERFTSTVRITRRSRCSRLRKKSRWSRNCGYGRNDCADQHGPINLIVTRQAYRSDFVLRRWAMRASTRSARRLPRFAPDADHRWRNSPAPDFRSGW